MHAYTLYLRVLYPPRAGYFTIPPEMVVTLDLFGSCPLCGAFSLASGQGAAGPFSHAPGSLTSAYLPSDAPQGASNGR